MTHPTLIDGKKILYKISSGGCAIVYNAWDEVLETHYAIKVMKPDAADNADRFLTEAKVLAQLKHPSIPTILNFGKTDDGRPFICMEFIDGQDVKSLIEVKGKLPLPVALSIILQVARALQYAHNLGYEIYGEKRNGLIHRDIKPANILINKNGVVKLIDFGIVKVDKLSIHTSASAILGTPHYMAPEQLDPPDDDPKLDHRGDIYSLGCVLYECITGKCQFDAATISRILDSKMAGKYDLAGLSEIPSNVRKIISTATATEKGDRYADIKQMIDDLEIALSGIGATNRVEVGIKKFIETGEYEIFGDRRSSKKNWVIFPTVILLITGLVMLWKFNFLKPDAISTNESVLIADITVNKVKKTGIADSAIVDTAKSNSGEERKDLKVTRKGPKKAISHTNHPSTIPTMPEKEIVIENETKEAASTPELFKKGRYKDVVQLLSGKKSEELSDSNFLILCGSLLTVEPEKLGEYLFSRAVRDGYHHYLRGRFYFFNEKWEQARSSFLKTLTVPTIIPCDEENQFYLVNSAFYLYTKSPNISNRDFFKGQKNEYLIKYCSKPRKSKNCTDVEKMEESKNIF